MKVFITIQDISDQIQTEEQLRKSRDQLFQSQKMEALGTLVAGVAHEINNPINLIMYNIPLIQRIWQDFKPMFEMGEERFRHKKFGGLPYPFIRENLDQLIADMDLAAKRVETIVRRLKDFARKSSILEKTEISVNDAVQNALRLARSTLKKSKVTIETDLADDLPLIKGHLQSIEQVVLNLVINAYEAISHDQGKIRISSRFAEKEKNVVLLVEDNGCGMQPEIREKIFDPFFTEKQAQGGTGLGLSVSYSLIKSHEGDITCQSTPEKGSAFEIRLPLEPEKRLIRVLIADDDPALRKLLSGALTRSRDFMVETATNGTEALIRLGTWMPDLLVLDLFMPQMNGLEVCRTIIREQKLSKMKVVIITGMPGSPEIEEIKKIGYVHVFEKPLKIKQFINDISRLFLEENRKV
jgi:signal transduction histidine kinase